MTYRDALWTAIIGENEKFIRRIKITRAKRIRYMKLVRYWGKTF